MILYTSKITDQNPLLKNIVFVLTQIYMYLLNSEKAQGSKTLKLFRLDKYRVKMKVHLILNINRFSPAIFMMLRFTS